MQKLRQIVSDLAQDVRALNLDDRISFRYLANKFRDKFATFLRIEARSREIFKITGVWEPLNYIELEDVQVTPVGNINDCFRLKRSVNRIPDSFATNYGLLVKILTLDGLKELTQIAQSYDYNAYTTREYPTGKLAYWLQDGRVYIANTDVEAVRGLIIPKDPIEVSKFNAICEACASPLDAELNYPDYLISLAKQEILRDIQVRTQVTEDEKPDDNTNRK